MKRTVEKEAKVALCRVCHGVGRTANTQGRPCVCPQCEGSGRVTVSMKAEFDIRPYRDR